MTLICPRCAEENPDRARFCMVCAEPLGAEPSRREERKVVSVLFVDLVGFTAASEAADPEDVRARLTAYHGRAKAEVERFGGTIEKFVGDAVMAVFGAPVAHEDDAERAVRSGLAILAAIRDLGLEARAAVNAGEAVVALDARPELGEGIVTGDVVNTAARLQSAAPAGALVAGEQAYWATRHVIDYEPLEPVDAKGKAEPVPVWLARGARSRLGVDLEPTRATPFVGRDDELEVLRQVYARTLRESACHLVTLVGEPGIGKSRLVAELRDFVDAREEIVFWRQGRCLPYGEGIALWALGEIVKAHAGILESDDPAAARAKLDEILEPLVSDGERAWIATELARLVGAAEAGGKREESFAAWREFLEAVAAQRPLVLVLEDLHWADSLLLEFVEHLADWSAGVPLLVVCTARPELHELHPAWGGGKRNATTISLSPLSGGDTARLIAALLERSVLPAETQQALLDRAGGNPLYAEQFVRMLRERPAGGEIPVPETVQALIAARLDTLGPVRKSLLQDAAVIGKVFWSGAVAAVGGHDERAVRDGLHELARRELVRPSRLSSVEGQAELAFGHGLVRDVAYAQIPRAGRVRKHQAAAGWIELIAGDRVRDQAELLAHHYREALRLARSAGLETSELEAGARTYIPLAAERMASLDAAKAHRLFEEALELMPPRHPARARTLTKSVELAHPGMPVERAMTMLDEAIAELRAAGDEVGLGKALVVESHLIWIGGDGAGAMRLLADAVPLLQRHEPGPELAHAYALSAGQEAIAARPEAALEWAAKGIELAARLGLDHFVERCRQFRGIARCSLGDLGGLEDLREALRVSLERGFTQEAHIGYDNYASWLWTVSGPEAALPLYEESIDFILRRGRESAWNRAELMRVHFDLGRWDEVLETAQELEDRPRGQPAIMARTVKGRVLFYRGRREEAAALAREVLPRARSVGDPQILLPALSLAALVASDRQNALALLEELLAVEAPENPLYPDSARVCVRFGALDLAERMIRGDERAAPRARHVGATISAILAEARGERDEAALLYAEAAERWQEHSFVLERGLCLLGAGRGEEAAPLLRSLGAESLLAAA